MIIFHRSRFMNNALPDEVTKIAVFRARPEASRDFVETAAQEFDVESFVVASLVTCAAGEPNLG